MPLASIASRPPTEGPTAITPPALAFATTFAYFAIPDAAGTSGPAQSSAATLTISAAAWPLR